MPLFRAGLVFFGVVYLLQGAILAYISNFQKSFLVNHQVTPKQIGALTSAMLIPFILKIFIGALSDRVRIGNLGRRKPYLILGLLICFGCYLFLGRIDPGADYRSFLLLSVLSTLGLALFDTTADGLAIDTASEEEEGPIQTAMMIGKSIGYIVFSYAFGRVVTGTDVGEVFAILTVMTAVVLIICLFVEEPSAKAVVKQLGSPWSRIFNLSFVLLSIFAVSHCITSFGVDGLITLFLNRELNHSLEIIGHYGSARGLGAVLGALLSLLLIKHCGLKRSLYAGIISVCVGTFAVAYYPKSFPVEPLGVGWGLAWGLLETVFLTMAMEVAKGPWNATCFAVLAMMCNVGTALGEGIAPSLASRFGFRETFFYLAIWVAILPVFMIWIYFQREKKRAGRSTFPNATKA